MEVKIATKEDLPEILDLQLFCYKEYGWAEKISPYADPLMDTLDSITEDFKTQTFFIARIDGKLVGVCRGYMVDEDSCCMARASTHPEFKGNLIYMTGRNLITETFKHAKKFVSYTMCSPEMGNKYIRYLRMSGWKHIRTEHIIGELTKEYFEMVNTHG